MDDDYNYPQNRDAVRVVNLMARSIGNYPRTQRVMFPHDLEIATRVHRTLTAEGWVISKADDHEGLDGEDEDEI